ncbi:CsbD family protein [Acidipila sp. EB88]|uniref:CsbD family protein n=1 Tax=Acidipila sp. EB88 TaxID=2305226 RepID=UPI000F5E1262|nr:CsbD family protein [Acidipila sp. EB88]RRA49179.1 CsbD family protein [Acidipila sp. EB88]
MNDDKVKGVLQKIGGRVEEAAGTLVGDHNLKEAGQEDQIKGSAREAWGNVKDAGNALIDKAKAAKYDAEAKSERAEAFDREHEVKVIDRG